MRCISLWQPWATAVALKLKNIETRHWSTPYRGRLAIHAALRWGPDERAFANAAPQLPEVLPRGCIVATATLVDVRRTEDLLDGLGAMEAIYGNFGPGRYGWLLEDIVALAEPTPWKGKQGFFNVPNELLPEVARRGLNAPPHLAPAPDLFRPWGAFEGA